MSNRPASKPELWRVECYPSGTMIVTNKLKSPGDPHFYIFGPGGNNESESDRNKHQVCEDLCEYLNGGLRPLWLDDMERTSEGSLQAIDRTRIIATGPSYDADPPRLNWREDQSDAAKNARARLIDRIVLK